MITPLPLPTFGTYWFQNFGAVMLLGEVRDVEEVGQMEVEGARWEELCLGSFYVKPNYPGRSSHVCNGGFLVTEAARNRGVGRLMGEGYLEWAPKLVSGAFEFCFDDARSFDGPSAGTLVGFDALFRTIRFFPYYQEMVAFEVWRACLCLFARGEEHST